jgi:hypothetical protein
VSRHLLSALLLTGLVALTGVGQAGSLKDPLRPPVFVAKPATKNTSTPSWRLASTLVAGDQRSAVINGRVLGLGDRVDGAEVVDIQPGQVRLRRADSAREFLVKLERRGIKQEPRP